MTQGKLGSRVSTQKSQKSVITNPSEKPIQIGTGRVSKGLKQAIEQADQINMKTFSDSYLHKIMAEVAEGYDLRATIFGTFYRVGFDLHELSPQEK